VTNNSKPVVKSGNYIAIWFNIVVCGGLIVFGIVQGVINNPVFFGLAVVGVFIELSFVRNLRDVIQERKEDTGSR
jgi:hypothetical protein